MTTLRFSCVVDDSPLFRMQAVNWVWSILASGLANPKDIVVYLIEGNVRAFQASLGRLGVTTRRVGRFGDGDSAYCNKLLQLDCSEQEDFDCLIMCDADVAFAGDIRPWVSTNAVRAKVVDFPNPQLNLIERLYAVTGLTAVPRLVETTFNHGVTYETNCNGGLYFIPRQWIRPLGEAWMKWSRFALERGDILRDRLKNADQLGFCFAMIELGLAFEPLPVELNFPAHMPAEEYASLQGSRPLVLHYHRRLDQHGFLLPLGVDYADEAITRVNRMIAHHRHQQFDNKTFWDYRYAYHAELGSGMGSRGDSLVHKRQIIGQAVDSLCPASVLDIGCGDQYVTENISSYNYTGIDLSKVVIEQAMKRYPRRRYIVGDFLNENLPQFEMTICLDVVIHLDSLDRYREFVRRVVSSSSGHGIISGYEESPRLCSDITFFHEPLSQTLKACGAMDLKRLGIYRDTTIWQFKAAAAS